MPVTDESTLIEARANAQRWSVYKATKTSEAAGIVSDLFTSTGSPGAGSTPSPGLGGQTVNSATAGVLPYVDQSWQDHVLSLNVSNTVAGVVTLYDRLWQNSGVVVTTTTAQAITFSGLPSRDANGATDGDGVGLWLEVYTATTNAGAVTTITASYTNQDGTSGKTATISSFPATAVAGTMVQFGLAAGDTGVRSVQSVTLGTTLGGGAVGLVCLRRIADAFVPVANLGVAVDVGLPKIYDGSALSFMFLNTTTATGNMYASLEIGGTSTDASGGGGGGGGATQTPVEFTQYLSGNSATVIVEQVTDVRETAKGIAIDTTSGTVVVTGSYASVIAALGW